jgi:hypothetical protein
MRCGDIMRNRRWRRSFWARRRLSTMETGMWRRSVRVLWLWTPELTASDYSFVRPTYAVTPANVTK